MPQFLALILHCTPVLVRCAFFLIQSLDKVVELNAAKHMMNFALFSSVAEVKGVSYTSMLSGVTPETQQLHEIRTAVRRIAKIPDTGLLKVVIEI